MCLCTVPYVSYVSVLLGHYYRGISAPRHGKEVVDGLNTVEKRDSKTDAATTTAYSKHLISLLKEKKLLTTYLSTVWEKMMVVLNNTYVPLNCTVCQLCLSVTPL